MVALEKAREEEERKNKKRRTTCAVRDQGKHATLQVTREGELKQVGEFKANITLTLCVVTDFLNTLKLVV